MKGTEVPTLGAAVHVVVRHKPRLHVSCNLGMRQAYLVLQLLFAAEPGRSLRLCAIPLWITAGSFCLRDPLMQICRGAQPSESSVQGGCSPPRPPAPYASDVYSEAQHKTINR